MNRRDLLRVLAPAAGALTAGCTGGGGDPDGTATATERPSASPTPTEYRVVDRSFAVLSSDCGTPTDDVRATLDPDPPAPDATEHVLTVTGVATGSDSCHTARLAALEPGQPGGTMRVGVETYVPDADADKACLECLIAIEYELAVTTVGGRPGAVEVTHDGEEAGRVELPE